MKKTILTLAVIFCITLIFSCNKTEKPQAHQPETFEEIESIEISGITNPGFSLLINAGFYTLFGEDTGDETTKVKWNASMSLGEGVLTGKIRRITFDNDKKVYDFVEVRRDTGREGFSLATQVAIGGKLAVVIDERATLFRTPKTVDVTGTIMSRKTIVVFYPESENNGFVEVRAYDPVRREYVSANIKNMRLSALSDRNDDVQSSILLQTALSFRESDKIQRDALLEAALLDYPNSIFYTEIFDTAHPNTTGIIEPAPADSE